MNGSNIFLVSKKMVLLNKQIKNKPEVYKRVSINIILYSTLLTHYHEDWINK